MTHGNILPIKKKQITDNEKTPQYEAFYDC